MDGDKAEGRTCISCRANVALRARVAGNHVPEARENAEISLGPRGGRHLHHPDPPRCASWNACGQQIKQAWEPDEKTVIVLVDPSAPNVLNFSSGAQVTTCTIPCMRVVLPRPARQRSLTLSALRFPTEGAKSLARAFLHRAEKQVRQPVLCERQRRAGASFIPVARPPWPALRAPFVSRPKPSALSQPSGDVPREACASSL